MRKLVLYFISPSPPSRAVLLLLRHLELNVDVKVVELDHGEQFKEDFLRLNPAHEVPVLVDGDFSLSESRAILAYLVNSRAPNSDLYPTEPKARAVIDHRLSYDHVLFTRSTICYRPILHAGQKKVLPQSRDNLIESIKVTETFLEKSKWIAGDNLTIADFSVLGTISSIVALGYNLDQHPNLARWYKQCQQLKGIEENNSGAAALAKLVQDKAEGAIF